MNKSILLGMGIFLSILLTLLSLSTTADVNAQSILNNDTNITPSTIQYTIEISELGLANIYDTSYDNSTNITSIVNTTHAIDYECGLYILYMGVEYSAKNTTADFYNIEGTTSNLEDIIIIDQILNKTLADNYYNILLNCTYYINTTNITSIVLGELGIKEKFDSVINETSISLIGLELNETFNGTINETFNATVNESFNSTINETFNATINEVINESINVTVNETTNETIIELTWILSSRNIVTNKSILIDTHAPEISIANQSISRYNGTASIDIAITDISYTVCMLLIGNQTINFSVDAQNDINTTNSTNNTNNTNINNANNTNTANITNNIPVVNTIIPLNLSIGNHTVNISCYDALMNNNIVFYPLLIFEHYVNTTNTTNTTNVTNDTINEPFFNITLSKSEFGLGELGYYTIDASNNSNVSITICPIASGWVQCYMTPPFINESFPKTQALPYTNKTGKYLIEGVMRYNNYTLIRNATYDTTNTLTAEITQSQNKGVVGDQITFNATASSGVPPYNYKWTLHDNTKFTGIGAFKKYTAAGTYRVNLTVSDSQGNNYSTYTNVVIKNKYTLTVIVSDVRNNNRLKESTVELDDEVLQVDNNGIATFTMPEGQYDLRVFRESYRSYSEDIDLDTTRTIYVNLSFYDLTPPKITLLTANDVMFNRESVDLKFKAEDASNVACSLYIAESNSSWYTLKDSGDNLLVNTQYTFEIRDLINGAYKWKIECFDSDNNKGYSEEREFMVSDGEITLALQTSSQLSDNINAALDNLDKLSGDESDIAEVLSIKADLKYLLDRINSLDRDMHDLSYRRDLDENGRIDAQKNLTERIAYLKNSTPVALSVKESKTFVKYVHDEDLESLLEEYASIKNMNINNKLFLESTKLVQSKVIISTRVRNVELYYLDGRIKDITIVLRDIQAAKIEDDQSIRNSNTITFVEVIPKTISQTTKKINMLNKEYTILKDAPLIEYPSNTKSIIYYLDGMIPLEEFQNADTVMIEKNINTVKSTTGLSILGIESISDINVDGRGVMIILIVLLIIFYIVINFDLIEKIRGLNIGFMGLGYKKRISFIKVLVNDAMDYLKAEDYDKAALIYREIKLSYEGANDNIRREVYDESFDLCNQLDMAYALNLLDKAEYFIRLNDRNNAIIEFEKLESTYNRLNESYQKKIDDRFHTVMNSMKF
ncbi:MAG: PKD domain-containing protein [Candidatus Woesearchaeota archaeon]